MWYILKTFTIGSLLQLNLYDDIFLYIFFQHQWRRSGVFIANFEHISYLVLVLLTFSRWMLAGNFIPSLDLEIQDGGGKGGGVGGEKPSHLLAWGILTCKLRKCLKAIIGPSFNAAKEVRIWTERRAV